MPKQTDKELELFFKNARHEQKLTYEELAEKAEMSSRYLKEIENGGRVPSFHKSRFGNACQPLLSVAEHHIFYGHGDRHWPDPDPTDPPVPPAAVRTKPFLSAVVQPVP